ncbi:hypothetical protein LguiA_025884 [Lonicera macranthoides]
MDLLIGGTESQSAPPEKNEYNPRAAKEIVGLESFYNVVEYNKFRVLEDEDEDEDEDAGAGEGEGESEDEGEGSTEEEFPHYVLYTDDETEDYPSYVYDTDEDSGITQEDYDRYVEQCEESEGFTVERFPSAKFFSIIAPFDLSNKFVFRDVVKCAQFALNEKEGTKYAFDRVIRANGQVVRGILYFITFAAKDANGHEVKFQTRVLAAPEGLDVELFRTEPIGES